MNGETASPTSDKPSDDIVQLQVGERRFTTTRSTLVEESTYFESLLSGRWNTAREDGSYFVDADPDIFVHILRYLRRGILPVFYDVQKGYDHALYAAVLKEAQFFGIKELERYIDQEWHLNQVRVTKWVEEVDYSHLPADERSDMLTEYYPQWATLRKVYVCPRGIATHRGHPDQCGRQGMNAKGDDPRLYKDEHGLKVFAVHTHVALRD